jgi:hypothetical protein
MCSDSAIAQTKNWMLKQKYCFSDTNIQVLRYATVAGCHSVYAYGSCVFIVKRIQQNHNDTEHSIVRQYFLTRNIKRGKR